MKLYFEIRKISPESFGRSVYPQNFGVISSPFWGWSQNNKLHKLTFVLFLGGWSHLRDAKTPSSCSVILLRKALKECIASPFPSCRNSNLSTHSWLFFFFSFFLKFVVNLTAQYPPPPLLCFLHNASTKNKGQHLHSFTPILSWTFDIEAHALIQKLQTQSAAAAKSRSSLIYRICSSFLVPPAGRLVSTVNLYH